MLTSESKWRAFSWGKLLKCHTVKRIYITCSTEQTSSNALLSAFRDTWKFYKLIPGDGRSYWNSGGSHPLRERWQPYTCRELYCRRCPGCAGFFAWSRQPWILVHRWRFFEVLYLVVFRGFLFLHFVKPSERNSAYCSFVMFSSSCLSLLKDVSHKALITLNEEKHQLTSKTLPTDIKS